MEITKSPDRRSATIKIDGVFTAAQLQTLISRLGNVRADMSPPVPLDDPTKETDGTVEASTQDDPHFVIAMRTSGDFRLWVRNAGIGWIAFHIPARKARALADFISARTGPSINLVSKEIGDGDGPH